MSQQKQATYTCRCGKKHQLLAEGKVKVCGCGRKATLKDGKLTIEDKRRTK